MKWEYMVIVFAYSHQNDDCGIEMTENKNYYICGSEGFLIKKLDEFGAKGWELSVGMSPTNTSSTTMILKKSL